MVPLPVPCCQLTLIFRFGKEPGNLLTTKKCQRAIPVHAASPRATVTRAPQNKAGSSRRNPKKKKSTKKLRERRILNSETKTFRCLSLVDGQTSFCPAIETSVLPASSGLVRKWSVRTPDSIKKPLIPSADSSNEAPRPFFENLVLPREQHGQTPQFIAS
jgi:hypothetical protein